MATAKGVARFNKVGWTIRGWVWRGVISPQSREEAMPLPRKKENFLLTRHVFAHFGELCGDCLDVSAYSSGMYILLQTDFTTEIG